MHWEVVVRPCVPEQALEIALYISRQSPQQAAEFLAAYEAALTELLD